MQNIFDQNHRFRRLRTCNALWYRPPDPILWNVYKLVFTNLWTQVFFERVYSQKCSPVNHISNLLRGTRILRIFDWQNAIRWIFSEHISMVERIPRIAWKFVGFTDIITLAHTKKYTPAHTTKIGQFRDSNFIFGGFTECTSPDSPNVGNWKSSWKLEVPMHGVIRTCVEFSMISCHPYVPMHGVIRTCVEFSMIFCHPYA